MKKLGASILSALFIILGGAPIAWGQLPASVAAYGREFAKEFLGIQATYALATNRIPAKYARDLEALQAKFQEAGDLDALLAVKKEVERYRKAKAEETDPFETVPEMPADAIVAEPAELRQLQERYVESFTAAASDFKKGVSDCGDRLRAQIKAAETALTKAGKIEEAIAMRNAGDRVAEILESGDFSALIGAAGAAAAQQAASDRPRAGSNTPASSVRKPATPSEQTGKTVRWRFRATRAFSRDLPRYFAPDVPNELTADYSASKFTYTLSGKCTIAAAQVGDVLCSWNGRAFLWDVAGADDLAADIRIKSRTLSGGADRGPQFEVAVLANGIRVKSLSIPVCKAEDLVRIVRDASNGNRFSLYWPLGSKSAVFEVPSGAKLNVLIGAVLHNPGETCDLSFQLDGSN